MGRSPRWLRTLVILYVGLLVGVPLVFVFQRAFAHGAGALWTALQDPSMGNAIGLTIRVVLVALPVNTIVGVGAALWIVRHPSWLTRIIDRVIDVPLAISPIIIGLMLELAYA